MRRVETFQGRAHGRPSGSYAETIAVGSRAGIVVRWRSQLDPSASDRAPNHLSRPKVPCRLAPSAGPVLATPFADSGSAVSSNEPAENPAAQSADTNGVSTRNTMDSEARSPFAFASQPSLPITLRNRPSDVLAVVGLSLAAPMDRGAWDRTPVTGHESLSTPAVAAPGEE
jgi:hypothetical protein